MKKFRLYFYLIFILSITFASCTKEGSVGPAGPAGQNGANGTNGNANVVTTTFTYTWASSQFPFSSFTLDFLTASITQDIINTGAIIGYVSPDNISWFQLPYFKRLSPNIQINFRPRISVGHYYIEFARNDGANITQTELGGESSFKFRVVTISK